MPQGATLQPSPYPWGFAHAAAECLANAFLSSRSHRPPVLRPVILACLALRLLRQLLASFAGVLLPAARIALPRA